MFCEPKAGILNDWQKTFPRWAHERKTFPRRAIFGHISKRFDVGLFFLIRFREASSFLTPWSVRIGCSICILVFPICRCRIATYCDVMRPSFCDGGGPNLAADTRVASLWGGLSSVSTIFDDVENWLKRCAFFDVFAVGPYKIYKSHTSDVKN